MERKGVPRRILELEPAPQPSVSATLGITYPLGPGEGRETNPAPGLCCHTFEEMRYRKVTCKVRSATQHQLSSRRFAPRRTGLGASNSPGNERDSERSRGPSAPRSSERFTCRTDRGPRVHPPRGRCHWSPWTGEGQGSTACPSWEPQAARQPARTWSLCGDSPSSCSSVLTLTHGTRVRRTRVSGPHVGSLAPGPGPVSTSQRAMSRSPAPQSGNEAQP